MDSLLFIEKCKELVRDYTDKRTGDGDTAPDIDVFVVWQSKVLQNNKALLSTTLFDGMYYEVTFNGEKSEIYFDAYKKFENICIEYK